MEYEKQLNPKSQKAKYLKSLKDIFKFQSLKSILFTITGISILIILLANFIPNETKELANPVKNEIANPVKNEIANPVKNEIANPVKNEIANPVKNEIANPWLDELKLNKPKEPNENWRNEGDLENDSAIAYIMMDSFLKQYLAPEETTYFFLNEITDQVEIRIEKFMNQYLIATTLKTATETVNFSLNHIADQVEYLGHQKYLVTLYTHDQNIFGLTIRRNKFIGELEQIDEDHWNLNSLDIFPIGIDLSKKERN